MPGDLQPLDQYFAIAKEDGTPTDYFIKWAQQRQIDISSGITAEQAEQLIADFLAAHPLSAGQGIAITPSGNIGDDITIALDADLNDLNDVDTVTTPPTDGQALVWVDADALWKPGDVASGGGGGGGGLTQITQVVLTATASSIDLTDLDQSFDDLVIVVSANSNSGNSVDDMNIRFNNDSGANYDWERSHAYSSGTNFSQGTIQTAGIVGNVPGNAAGTRVGQSEIFIANYAKTTNYKSAVAVWEASIGTLNFTQGSGIYGNTWRNTAAINRVTLFPGAGSFKAGTVVSVYGRGKAPKAWPGNVIQEFVCAGGETEVVFSNIPQTFRDLQIRSTARVNAAGNDVQMKIQCNGDTGNNYAHQQVFANGGTLTGVRSSGVSAIVWMQATGNSNALPNLWASGHFDFGDYKSTLHNKTGFGNSYNRDGDTRELTYSGEWRSNSAITSIRVFPNSGSFVAGTVITLYGIGGPGSATIYNRPWYWNPPVASSFALQSGDATMPILTDDLDVGLLFNANTPVAGDEVRMAYRTLTNKALDWSVTVRMNWGAFDQGNFAGFGIYLRDSVGGRVYEFGWDAGSSDLLLRSQMNSLTSYSSNVQATQRGYAQWMRVRSVGATLFWEISADGKLWRQFLTDGVTSWLANRADQVGFGARLNRTNHSVYYSIDHFSLTGPAV